MNKSCEYIKQKYKNLKDVQDLYYAAMWHDIGKKYCKSFINGKGEKLMLLIITVIRDIAHGLLMGY